MSLVPRPLCTFQLHDETTPFTSSGAWGAGMPLASPALPKDGKRVPQTNAQWGDETRAELKSGITEHTRYPSRLRTRNHWCPPAHFHTCTTRKPAIRVGHRLLGGEGHILRGGPEPQLQDSNTTFVRLRSEHPPPPPAPALPCRHRTQHLPRPCHLGRLTHVSPTAAATSSAV